MRHTMHLRPGVAKQPNLDLKTQPKQLLGSLPLVIALPGATYRIVSIYVAPPKAAKARLSGVAITGNIALTFAKKSLKLNVFTNDELSAVKDESMTNHCF
jgi:hypothetical protein